MAAYATRQDLYRYAPVRGSLTSNSREVSTSTASTDILELEGHGLETGDTCQVRAIAGGSLSSPLAAATTYYAIKVDDSRIKLATSSANASAGTAINLTTDGVTMALVTPLPVDEVLEFYSRFVDGLLPAHAVPLDSPYPVTIVALVAELSAHRLQLIAGTVSESMKEMELAAVAQLQRYAQGIPLRDARVTSASTNLAVTSVAASATTGLDARGWGSGTLP